VYDWMVQNIPYFKDKGDSNSSAGWKVRQILDTSYQCSGSGSRVLMTKKFKKFTAEQNDKKVQFTYPYASIKDVQATGEAFSPQKRTSSTSKHEIS
jgi:hypothetical protein